MRPAPRWAKAIYVAGIGGSVAYLIAAVGGGALLTRTREGCTRLVGSTPLKFDENLRSALPEAQGLYRVFANAPRDHNIRAGRTKTARGGLRYRAYQNHLMGSQVGNLRARLVADRTCADTPGPPSE